jgi:hypothetical protein
MKEIEIKNFTLEYDGIFRISFDGINKPVFLTPGQLFKMFKIEGLIYEDFFEEHAYFFEPVNFKKVDLILKGSQDEDGEYSFLTSEAAEIMQEKGLYLLDVSIKTI